MPDGKLERKPMNQISLGDTVAVHTGEKISVDGKVVYGAAVVDQSPITGEFVPVEKREGDEVFAGTVVKSGNIHVQAAKVGDQTVISRIVGMVEASELKKAPIQRYADKFSNYLVPLNFLLCLSVWLVTKNPQKALKMLVIDYSCGIKLSTATAFSAAINTAVKQGVLIKGGTFIEQMSSANTVLLDKTGTITEGRPRIVSAVVLKEGMSEKEVLSYAMAAEETSTHPLAGAIMALRPGAGRVPQGARRRGDGGVPRQPHTGGQKEHPRRQYRIHAGKRREGRRSPAR
ncbi:MAG: HAD-IC family P-type ATPase [Lachnospiraceae bacterium]